jgi:hypothetical protein
MLTQEQIQNLKEGDPLIIHGTYKGKHSDGDLRITSTMTVGDSLEDSIKTVHPSCVSLPSEIVNSQSSIVNKHDPTRLFKKGDKVRVVEWNGRKDCRNGMEATVLSNERGCFVDIECMIKAVKAELTYPACQLELVTPVEEIEPYKLIDSPNTYNIVRDSAMVMTIHKKSHPNPKAAAEAECARLNAEWRKEHNND